MFVFIQAELNNGSPVHGKSTETIRYFSPTDDKLPSTFRLMKVKGLPPWANTNAVSIGDVVQVLSSSWIGASQILVFVTYSIFIPFPVVLKLMKSYNHVILKHYIVISNPDLELAIAYC